MNEEVNISTSPDGAFVSLNGIVLKKSWLNAYVSTFGIVSSEDCISGFITAYNSPEQDTQPKFSIKIREASQRKF